MKYEKRIFISIFWIILGITLIVCGFTNVLDTFWQGMGSAFVVIGILQTIRQIKYRKDALYRENFDTEMNDERNRFIANKAWAWSGYLYVILAAILSIVFKLINQELLMMYASGSICFIVLIYRISYMFLKRKY